MESRSRGGGNRMLIFYMQCFIKKFFFANDVRDLFALRSSAKGIEHCFS